jgi:hypothetical protein
VTFYTHPCNPYKVICLLHYLPLVDESSPRGGWSICALALPEVLTLRLKKYKISLLLDALAASWVFRSCFGGAIFLPSFLHFENEKMDRATRSIDQFKAQSLFMI